MPVIKDIGFRGVGHYLPPNRVENDHFVSIGLDTSPDWIKSRSGILTRYIASEHQQTSDLAVEAAQSALKNANLNPSCMDFIIVATATPDFQGFPSTACMVHHKLGINRSVECFDVTAACSGFAYAINIAYSKICAGLGQYGLIIGAETLSRLVDWADRRTCILFGDGAGAAIIGPVKTGGFLGFNQGADGAFATILSCQPSNNAIQFSGKAYAEGVSMIQMDGPAVFKKGVQVVVNSLSELLEKSKISIHSIDHIVCHQANQRILSAVAKQTGIPIEKFIININRVGNTSAASIPLALSEAICSNQIKSGDIVALVGFGSGFTWSSILLEWS